MYVSTKWLARAFLLLGMTLFSLGADMRADDTAGPPKGSVVFEKRYEPETANDNTPEILWVDIKVTYLGPNPHEYKIDFITCIKGAPNTTYGIWTYFKNGGPDWFWLNQDEQTVTTGPAVTGHTYGVATIYNCRPVEQFLGGAEGWGFEVDLHNAIITETVYDRWQEWVWSEE